MSGTKCPVSVNQLLPKSNVEKSISRLEENRKWLGFILGIRSFIANLNSLLVGPRTGPYQYINFNAQIISF